MGLWKLVTIHCKLFYYHQYDNEMFSFKRNYRFYKGHPPVSISIGIFFGLSYNMIHQIYKSEENKRFWILLSLHKLLDKELRTNYVPEIGTDVMHGSKLFAVITGTFSSVRILTDGATRRLVLYMFRLHPGYHNTPVTRRTIDRSIIQMELFSNLLLQTTKSK